MKNSVLNKWLPLLVVLAGLLAWIAVPVVNHFLQDRVSRSSYDTIQIGMTVQEVEAIIGPQGVYHGKELAWFRSYLLDRDDDDVMRWQGRKGILELVISKDGRVTQKHFFLNADPWNHVGQSRQR